MPEPVVIGCFDDLAAEEVFPGVFRRSVSAEGSTVTSYRFEPGASFPMHRHASEQVTLVQEGEVAFTAAATTNVLRAGAWSIVARGVEHGITAGPSGARVLAMVTPRRDAPDAYELVPDADGPVDSA